MIRRSVALVAICVALQGGPALAASYCQSFPGRPTPNYVNQGLGLIPNVSIYQIFLDSINGSYWTTSPGNVQGLNIELWGYVTNAPAFWSRVTEYGVGRDANTPYTTSRTLVTPLISTVSTAGIEATLESLFSRNTIPFSTGTVYMVYLSPSVSFGNGGFHRAFNSASKHAKATYAVIQNGSAKNADQSNGSMGSVSSHELLEAATDPYWNLWQYGWLDVNTPPAAYTGANGKPITCSPSSPCANGTCKSGQCFPASCLSNQSCNELGDTCGNTGENNGSVTGGMQGRTVSLVWSQQACRCVLARNVRLDDFDGDGYEDPALWMGRDFATTPTPYFVYWPSTTGTLTSTEQVGTTSDYPAVADFDGDWKADRAVWRGTYYQVNQSSDGWTKYFNIGSPSDDPVPADFDGDGKADPATWSPSSGIWHVLLSGSGYAVQTTQWGMNGDTPGPSDFDGDGIADCAVFRPNDPYRGNVSDFIIKLSSTGATRSYALGQPTDIPAPADLDGDGLADPAVYRESTAQFFWLSSAANYTLQAQSVGVAGGSGLPMPRRWTNSNGGQNKWNNAATLGVRDYQGYPTPWYTNFWWPSSSPVAHWGTQLFQGDPGNLPVSLYYY